MYGPGMCIAFRTLHTPYITLDLNKKKFRNLGNYTNITLIRRKFIHQILLLPSKQCNLLTILELEHCFIM